MATEFVMEEFNESFIDEQSQQLMEEIKDRAQENTGFSARDNK
jgi:hypothetical protein